jgi:hypothetical protein
VVAYEMLDLFGQVVVRRHANHVACRDQALNPTPERLPWIRHARSRRHCRSAWSLRTFAP